MNLIERIEAQGEAFDYEQLDDATALEAKAVVERYRARTETYIFDTGKDLLAIKDKLEHGQFLEWTRAEMNMPSRTAQQYMQAASKLGHKCATVAHLPATTIYRLTSASTPEHVRDDIVRRLEAKEALPAKAIDMLVDEAKEEARKKATEEKEAARRAALSDEERVSEDARNKRRDRRESATLAHMRRHRLERKQADAARRLKAEQAARTLIERLGLDDAAAFVAEFQEAGPEIFHRLEYQAQIDLAAEGPIVELPANDIYTDGVAYGFLSGLDEDDRERVRQLAEEIKRDGLREPLTVRKRKDAKDFQPYEIIDGNYRLQALRELGASTFPSRIAPPFKEIAQASAKSD